MKNALYFLGICAVVSCAPDVRTIDLEIDPVFTQFDEMPPDCMEAKMELWFELFHQYQDDGFGMFQADEKARHEVEEKLAVCGNDQVTAHIEKKSARK